MRLHLVALAGALTGEGRHTPIWRSLLGALAARGHALLVLERSPPGIAAWPARAAGFGTWGRYDSLAGLAAWSGRIAAADALLVGSDVPDAAAAGDVARPSCGGVSLFYDLDGTAREPAGYHVVLNLSGTADALFPSADLAAISPEPLERRWDLGCIAAPGDAPPALLLAAARLCPGRRFAVACEGPLAGAADFPANVTRIEGLAPAERARFIAACGWLLDAPPSHLRAEGFCPDAALFQAPCLGTPVMSQGWRGLAALFTPGQEIVLAQEAGEVARELARPTAWRDAVAEAARLRVRMAHTGAHRASQLEAIVAAQRARLRAGRLCRSTEQCYTSLTVGSD